MISTAIEVGRVGVGKHLRVKSLIACDDKEVLCLCIYSELRDACLLKKWQLTKGIAKRYVLQSDIVSILHPIRNRQCATI